MSKISVVLPLLLPDEFCVAMTRFCLDALRINASGKHEIELVIVETASVFFDVERHVAERKLKAPLWHREGDQYINFPVKTSYVKDWNAGADAATGEYLVHIGNDVIVGKDWDEALLEPFRRFKNCGVSTTSALEFGNAPIGHRSPVPGVVVEGMFAPLMMFRKGWKFDEAYEGGYSDSDLIMRMYEEGLRAYRSYSSVCWHFGPMTTWERAYADKDKGWGQVNKGEETFYRRWKGSAHWMYAMIRAGGIQYGKEHVAALAPTPIEQRGEQGPR